MPTTAFEPGPAGDRSQDLLLMLLADNRFPTAGHTQSAGLEAALMHGLASDDIPAYCRTRLATVTRMEAGVAAVARHLTLHDRPLEPVEDAWAARTPSEALRAASYTLGRGYRRTASRVWPAVKASLAPLHRVSRPTVMGVVAAVAGVDAAGLVRLVGYDDVQTTVSAALKLVPFDPVVAAQWVHRLTEDVARLVPPLQDLTDPADVPARSAPLIESWAQAHGRSPRRLFHA